MEEGKSPTRKSLEEISNKTGEVLDSEHNIIGRGIFRFRQSRLFIGEIEVPQGTINVIYPKFNGEVLVFVDSARYSKYKPEVKG